MNKYVNKGKVLQNGEIYKQNYLITKKINTFNNKGLKKKIFIWYTVIIYIIFYLCQWPYRYSIVS